MPLSNLDFKILEILEFFFNLYPSITKTFFIYIYNIFFNLRCQHRHKYLLHLNGFLHFPDYLYCLYFDYFHY